MLVLERWVRLRSVEATCRVEWEGEGSEGMLQLRMLVTVPLSLVFLTALSFSEFIAKLGDRVST